MRLYPDCSYFGDLRDDPIGPGDSENCEYCMRYDTCKDSFDSAQREKEVID